MHKKVLNIFSLLTILVIAVSCIEFERQTMTYTIINDELLIFQEYEGIYGAKNPETLTAKEVTELNSVLQGGITFFFANWIFEYNQKAIKETLSAWNDKNSQYTVKELAAIKIYRSLIQHLLKNVKVTNGELYYNQRGQLSGYQTVRVKNITQLVTLANKAIAQNILYKFNIKNTSPETKIMITAKAQGNFQWLKITPNKIIIEWPMTAGDYKIMQNNIKKDQKKNKPNNYLLFQLMTKNISFHNNLVTTYIGKANHIPVVISGKVFGPYHDNAAAYLTQKTSIMKKIDLKQLKQEFFNRQ